MNVAIVGATGAVGEVLVELLHARGFPVDTLTLLASERSAGKRVSFGEHSLPVRDVAKFDFAGVGIAFFAAGGDVAAEHGARARAAGAIVIDKSSRFRLDPEVPLVVPEVNGACLADVGPGGLVASPNCSTVQLVMLLHPLQQAFGLARVNLATYQAVSGAGSSGVATLASETTSVLNLKSLAAPTTFAAQIAFNVVPRVERMGADGFTTEEEKVIAESRRLLGLPALGINPTCVRVPVFFGHGQAVHVELARPASLAEVHATLAAMPGLRVLTDADEVPTPVGDAVGEDEVVVGRIRRDPSHPCGFDFWTVADNTRKGAALNSVQIAEQFLAAIGRRIVTANL
jgi:aspartate-semialdehyde dehydrogenase